jgi:hypothetical protein
MEAWSKTTESLGPTDTYGFCGRLVEGYLHSVAATGQAGVVMHASEVTPEAIERVNELYWDTGRSVNQIADELDLSKGALYGVIRPQQAGLGCPLCGAEVGYPNRTAKDRGSLECPTCTWDGSVDETTVYVGDAVPGGVGEPGFAFDEYEQTVPTVDPDSDRTDAEGAPPAFIVPDLRTVAKGALIGGAVGLVLVLWARRR